MITEWDVYCAFRRAQANHNGRGYRLPKDWPAFQQKMAKQNQEWLYKAKVWFNTTYANVDLDAYMACGFELWKGFTYKHFCDNRVIELYIQKDKIKKRRMAATEEEIIKTFEFIEQYLEAKPPRPGYGQLQSFCKFRDGEVKSIINTYNQGQIDTLTLTYCIKQRYLVLTDDERALMPYIVGRYRELQENLQPLVGFIQRKELELNERTRQETLS